MTDTVIKGSGNSRSLKTVPNALTTYPTHEAMIAAMVDGTFPIDLGPLNPLGVNVMGTPLDAAHLVSMEVGTYVGSNMSGSDNPNSITFSFAPKIVAVIARYNGRDFYPYSKYSDYTWILNTNILTTEYEKEIGLGFTDTSFGKRSGDGKTIFWYTSDQGNRSAQYQMNEPNYSYYYFGIG